MVERQLDGTLHLMKQEMTVIEAALMCPSFGPFDRVDSFERSFSCELREAQRSLVLESDLFHLVNVLSHSSPVAVWLREDIRRDERREERATGREEGREET
jgi:hypothetical protein